jgi:hypothetical protein
MRIYVLSNATVKKNILAKLDPYLHNTRHICYIWSVNGLLQVEGDKIYGIKIKDVPSKKTLLGAFPVTIDESEFQRQEECYQIAPRSYKEYTILKTYSVSASSHASSQASSHASLLEWVLEYKDDELHDNYFTLPNGEDIHSAKNKADLLHFLNI